jgi:hypothetical protein
LQELPDVEKRYSYDDVFCEIILLIWPLSLAKDCVHSGLRWRLDFGSIIGIHYQNLCFGYSRSYEVQSRPKMSHNTTRTEELN